MQKNMKKLIIITFLFLGFVLPAKAVHYRGFVEIAPGINSELQRNDESYYDVVCGNEFAIGVSTTHGLQINKKLFLGLGVSGMYSHTWNNISTYLDGRFDFVSSRKFSPFVDLKIGFASYCDKVGYYYNYYGTNDRYYDYSENRHGGLYIAPTIGVRNRLTDNFALNIGLGWDYIYGRSPAFIGKSRHVVSLKVGIEF
jgi:hypothetical protein